MVELIKMLEKSKPMRVPGTAVFLTNDPNVAPSSFMHNLKHNKVLHERVVMMCVRTETYAARRRARALRGRQLSPDFMQVTLHFGYMEIAAHSRRARADAQGGAEVRHHDDVVLPRPPHAQAFAELGHAEMAGPSVHRD